jgi:hypothetical protein
MNNPNFNIINNDVSGKEQVIKLYNDYLEIENKTSKFGNFVISIKYLFLGKNKKEQIEKKVDEILNNLNNYSVSSSVKKKIQNRIKYVLFQTLNDDSIKNELLKTEKYAKTYLSDPLFKEAKFQEVYQSKLPESVRKLLEFSNPLLLEFSNPLRLSVDIFKDGKENYLEDNFLKINQEFKVILAQEKNKNTPLAKIQAASEKDKEFIDFIQACREELSTYKTEQDIPNLINLLDRVKKTVTNQLTYKSIDDNQEQLPFEQDIVLGLAAFISLIDKSRLVKCLTVLNEMAAKYPDEERQLLYDKLSLFQSALDQIPFQVKLQKDLKTKKVKLKENKIFKEQNKKFQRSLAFEELPEMTIIRDAYKEDKVFKGFIESSKKELLKCQNLKQVQNVLKEISEKVQAKLASKMAGQMISGDELIPSLVAYISMMDDSKIVDAVNQLNEFINQYKEENANIATTELIYLTNATVSALEYINNPEEFRDLNTKFREKLEYSKDPIMRPFRDLYLYNNLETMNGLEFNWNGHTFKKAVQAQSHALNKSRTTEELIQWTLESRQLIEEALKFIGNGKIEKTADTFVAANCAFISLMNNSNIVGALKLLETHWTKQKITGDSASYISGSFIAGWEYIKEEGNP